MCSTNGLLSLSSTVFMLLWFNVASIASVAANLVWLANTSLSRRDTACLALAMLAAYSFAVVRVVSIFISLRPSLARRGRRRVIHADDDGHALGRHILTDRCWSEAWRRQTKR